MSIDEQNKPKTLFTLIKLFSKVIEDGRKPYNVLAKQQEEMGELATEVNIAQGYVRRPPGKDGILGEAADVIITTVDQALLAKPDLTEEEFMKIAEVKLNKWYSYDQSKYPSDKRQLQLEL